MHLPKIVSPSGTIAGHYSPPGDKSISHRAVMFGALGDGKSVYRNFLQGQDCLHTLSAFQQMGVPITLNPHESTIEIEGVGLRGLRAPSQDLYLGNSGTSMRLILGILAGQHFEATLTGDPSLSSRPMKRVTHPLKQMGAQIKGKDHGNFAPLTIRGGKLTGITFDNHLSSAQVKSALLFAGLYADGPTIITEPLLSRDHTEKFLESAGVLLVKEDSGRRIQVSRAESLKAMSGDIPGDPSSAAFFITAAAIAPGSEVRIERVCLNPTRIGFLKVLERMGAKINIELKQRVPEWSGDITVASEGLKGVRIAPEEIPSLIDELPILMIAMALAEGESLISGASELRVKETDRILSMVTNLNAIGGRAEELPDGCLIRGVNQFQGGSIKSFDDHRTVMSFVVAALRSKNAIEIDDVASVSTSFPSFFTDFEKLKK